MSLRMANPLAFQAVTLTVRSADAASTIEQRLQADVGYPSSTFADHLLLFHALERCVTAGGTPRDGTSRAV